MCRPQAATLVKLGRLGLFDKLEQVADFLCEHTSHLRRCGEEEFASQVDLVQPLGGERMVELVLKGDGVVGEEQGVNVERERHRRVTELPDPS